MSKSVAGEKKTTSWKFIIGQMKAEPLSHFMLTSELTINVERKEDTYFTPDPGHYHKYFTKTAKMLFTSLTQFRRNCLLPARLPGR